MNATSHGFADRTSLGVFLEALTRLWRAVLRPVWLLWVAGEVFDTLSGWVRLLGEAAGHRGASAPDARSVERHRLLGALTATQVARLLEGRGVLSAIREQGYERLEVVVEPSTFGSRVRVYGRAHRQRHVLMELVVERRSVGGRMRLYIQWLLLQHPSARFRADRPALPGQEAPGLGVSSRILRLLADLAQDLGLAGIAYRPSWYHVAHRMSRHFIFADPDRQERFEALQQRLAHLSLTQASQVVHQGRAWLNGQPYEWEPDAMIERPRRNDEAGPRQGPVVVSTIHVRHRHDRDPRPHGAL